MFIVLFKAAAFVGLTLFSLAVIALCDLPTTKLNSNEQSK